jgi:hypothetical protein
MVSSVLPASPRKWHPRSPVLTRCIIAQGLRFAEDVGVPTPERHDDLEDEPVDE